MTEVSGGLTSDGYAAYRWSATLPSRRHGSPASGPSPAELARTQHEADAAHLFELLTRSSCGHEEALAELYDLTSSRIYGLVLSVVRSTDLAATVTQDVYVDVWRQSARYRPGNGSVLRWVLAMAHSKAVERVRLASSSVVGEPVLE